ncbi:MAG TPA: phosphoribosylformylglycinamidine synthase subunit PurS [Oligoflexus sp.]|uniref:phosphoribosylformylglycinamidine synthase subunit PurS n=1 Tax=Oligoflexus sp. TaxID=1971216 RepID=UPI002D807C74|nr:phosphoribosylformylglycinamidine synthase subunit PurS [Oligoflexus sp.]HET9236491.1 phosphoribosylformylglycinamidine synthase subunit PurS [Oligoflexus sp.]
MIYEVVVELKEEVLDTQGRAIQQTLARLGATQLKAVKVSKRFLLDLDGDEASNLELVQKLAAEHLANPVSETFKCRKI